MCRETGDAEECLGVQRHLDAAEGRGKESTHKILPAGRRASLDVVLCTVQERLLLTHTVLRLSSFVVLYVHTNQQAY